MNFINDKEKLVKKLTNKEYRDAWVDESVKTAIPYQIQAIRNKNDWSQELLGEKAGMRRNAISRLESLDYGNLSVNTLLRVAHGFDCGLLVKFVPFSRLVGEFEDVSPKGLEVESFENDFKNLYSWASKPKKKQKTIKSDETKQPTLFGEVTNKNLPTNDLKRAFLFTCAMGVEISDKTKTSKVIELENVDVIESKPVLDIAENGVENYKIPKTIWTEKTWNY